MDIFTRLLIMGLVYMGIHFMLAYWINLLEETNSYISFRSLWNSLGMFCKWLFPINSYYVSKVFFISTYKLCLYPSLYEYFSITQWKSLKTG